MRSVRSRIIAPLFGVALLAPSLVRADTLDAPAEVMAQPDGSFSYDVTFHKGPGTDMFAGLSYVGELNVQGGLFGDCFCFPGCPIYGPGDSFTFQVSGLLIDTEQPGRVRQTVAMCASPGASTTTDIRPYTVAGVPTLADGDMRFWNQPNPFSARTTFYYRLAEPGPVLLGIYDLAGRLVARLVDGVEPAGAHQATWDLSAYPGARQAGGVLFARLVHAGTVRNRTLILAR